MIARVWRGATSAADGEAYAAYIEESGTGPARELPGARGSLVLRRTEGDRTEFETIILFDSLDAMVRNIREHGEPDLEHTLNRLTMAFSSMSS